LTSACVAITSGRLWPDRTYKSPRISPYGTPVSAEHHRLDAPAAA
jgi:hypothetical protein